MLEGSCKTKPVFHPDAPSGELYKQQGAFHYWEQRPRTNPAIVTAASFLYNLFKHAWRGTLSAPEKKKIETKTHLQKSTYHIHIYVYRMTVHTRRNIFQDAVIFLFRAVCAIVSQCVYVCVFYRTCFIAKQCDTAFQFTVKIIVTD